MNLNSRQLMIIFCYQNLYLYHYHQTNLTSSPPSKMTNTLIKSSHPDESSSPFDISVDYWTIVGNNHDHQKEKKDGIRTIKSSLKSNIRMLTITRQAQINVDGKISSPLTMTYVTREKKQKSKILFYI
jgi:hypothetical protein